MTPQELAARRDKIVFGVDDQSENLVLLEAIITSAGYTFLGMTRGIQCLSLAARAKPRLILLDIQMPDMDGYETCRRLRADWTMARVPIAFLTVRKAPEDVKAGVAAGGNDFLVKPFDPKKLLARVDHWVRNGLSAKPPVPGTARPDRDAAA